MAFDETPSDWDWDPALVCNSCCCSIIVRSHCRPKKGLSIARYKNINKSSSLIMITPGHGCYHTHTQQHTRYFVCVYFLGCPVHLSNFTEIGEISEIPDPRFPNPDPLEISLSIRACCYLSKHSTLEARDFRGQLQQLNPSWSWRWSWSWSWGWSSSSPSAAMEL